MAMVLPEQATGSTGGDVCRVRRECFDCLGAVRLQNDSFLSLRNMTCGCGEKGKDA